MIDCFSGLFASRELSSNTIYDSRSDVYITNQISRFTQTQISACLHCCFCSRGTSTNLARIGRRFTLSRIFYLARRFAKFVGYDCVRSICACGSTQWQSTFATYGHRRSFPNHSMVDRWLDNIDPAFAIVAAASAEGSNAVY